MENCSNCTENKTACVPFFVHENVLEHYNRANRRMLIALLGVCATLILVVTIFVHGYTEREKNRVDSLTTIRQAEVADGVHEQQGP